MLILKIKKIMIIFNLKAFIHNDNFQFKSIHTNKKLQTLESVSTVWSRCTITLTTSFG
jgi:hypothetical protein